MSNEEYSLSQLERIAFETRSTILQILTEAGSGHTGGSLSATDLLVALYFRILHLDPKNPAWPGRDYFILSAGHLCPALYTVMAKRGFFQEEELATLRKFPSRLQGHPSRVDLPGIETSTGSLGQGINVAVGVALGIKRADLTNRVFCLMGDGEQEEGAVWEAAMAAAHYKLDNLTAIIDLNGQQQNGPTKEIIDSEPLEGKYKSFGWQVFTCDGNKMPEVLAALERMREDAEKPKVLLARTVMTKGVTPWQDDHLWHAKVPTVAQLQEALPILRKVYD